MIDRMYMESRLIDKVWTTSGTGSSRDVLSPGITLGRYGERSCTKHKTPYVIRQVLLQPHNKKRRQQFFALCILKPAREERICTFWTAQSKCNVLKGHEHTFWSVREYMLPMICAAILRVSVDRSWKALWTMGMIRASEGASIKCTNLVSSRVCRQCCVLCDGSVRASSRMGVMAKNRRN